MTAARQRKYGEDFMTEDVTAQARAFARQLDEAMQAAKKNTVEGDHA